MDAYRSMHALYIVVLSPPLDSIEEAVATTMAPLCDPRYTASANHSSIQHNDNFYWVALSPKRIASYEALLGVTSREFPLFVERLKAYRGYDDVKQEADGIFALIRHEYWFDYYTIGGRWRMSVSNNHAVVKDLPTSLRAFGLVTPEGEVITHELAETLTDDEAQELQGYKAFQADTDPYKVFDYVPGIDKDPHIWNSEYLALLDEYAHYLGVIIDTHS